MSLSNILKKLKQKLYSKELVFFLGFLLLALFVWFLNKLSHDYLYTIEYPVELYSTRNRQITFDEKETKLIIQQRIDGFSILKAKAIKTPTIRIDLNSDKYNKVPSTPNTYYLLTKSFTDVIDRQLGDDRLLVSVNPDTLFFTIGIMAEKKVPVRHQLNLTTEKEYMIRGDIVLTPDSITVSGSQATIDSILYVIGNPKSLVNLTESVEGNFDLLPIKGAYISSNQVRYYADIIRYTEGYFKATLKIDNIPSDVNITLLPNEVELKYRVALSDFPSIDTSQFTATVSYKDIADNNGDRTLAVKVTHKPKEVLSIHIIPPFVEYIIRKN